MELALHSFHIPVMGTGFTADTPVRVAPYGISSVISLVDDLLLERIREHYCRVHGLPYVAIPRKTEDGRAKRITAYLDVVSDLVHKKIEAIRKQSFFDGTEKDRYFRLLPENSPLKQGWLKMRAMPKGQERTTMEQELTSQMRAGSIDVNIMVKLDKVNRDAHGKALSDEFSDAKAALRGFANSKISSSLVFSAGINQGLYNYMAQFRDFYRDTMGNIRKKIVVKVSDFRSAMIQGRFLARKGLEVHEFRIESGLNCGGHAFASNGTLLASILKEVREKRNQLVEQFKPLVEKYYKTMGWDTERLKQEHKPLVTVQGGIGTSGEDRRMREYFGMDGTGWASPFLLVPEATALDKETRMQLAQATEKDLYLSDASPLGVPFNNLRQSGSEKCRERRNAEGNPGSPCPKGFLVSNTEFSEIPVCTASQFYQKRKLAQIDSASISEDAKDTLRRRVLEKSCICDHLGNSTLIALGEARDGWSAPQAICPGPNVAWFNRTYSLEEMVDHIYARRPSLVPPERPHMFVKELAMTVDWFEKQVAQSEASLESIR
ncbi:MAG TPA: hypothetical protein VLM37_08060, partial [Fibrobacteraceae bacterium]|nr:hypothetical protein [Fibrobacteraceae bacterium]